MNTTEEEKRYWKGYEKIKLNLLIEQRHARNWTHYDITMTDDENKHEFFHRSECYACYNPPYPSHRIDKKFDKKIELEELCQRLFCKQWYSDEYKYLNYSDTEVEIGNVKLVSERGYPIKFDLI